MNETSATPRLSPIDAAHRSLGATFTDFSGWRLPLRFSSELAEHRAVRDAAGLFDISHMGQLVIRGHHAAAVLSSSVVSDVEAIEPGSARYTMLCESDGGVIDDVIVYRLGENEFLVIANAANTEAVASRLIDQAVTRAVVIEDRTAERALFSLQGPNAPHIMAECVEDSLDLPHRYRFSSSVIADQSVLVARTGYTGEDGFEISVAIDGADAVWRRLLDGDGESVVLPAGLAARDSLRLEAGLPLYGHELTLERNPFAAGYGRIVDFSHDFCGRAALARIAEAESDQVLVGLVCAGQRAPRAGYGVRMNAGIDVGTVTSGGPSPTLGIPIAMAYLRRGLATVGTEVSIDVRGHDESAAVVSLPFYRRRSRAAVPGASTQVSNKNEENS